MIDVKSAAQAAAQYLENIFPEAKKIRIEEIELDDEQEYWNITLSFILSKDIDAISGSISELFKSQDNYNRTYKQFRIDAESGSIKSMKIRQMTNG